METKLEYRKNGFPNNFAEPVKSHISTICYQNERGFDKNSDGGVIEEHIEYMGYSPVLG